jgi:CRP-like cAMP-binding protein
MEKLLERLNRIGELSAKVPAYLRAHVERREVGGHEIILSPGQVADYVYFIETGLVRRCVDLEDIVYTKWIGGEGDFVISDGSFCTRGHSKEKVEMLEPGVLYGIRYDRLDALYTTCPGFERCHRVIVEDQLIQSEKKGRLMREPVSSRYAYFMERGDGLGGRVLDGLLASFLGMDEEELERSKLAYAGRLLGQ